MARWGWGCLIALVVFVLLLIGLGLYWWSQLQYTF